ncbi:glycerate kinase [candidate division KSB1 bacterium]
MRILIAPDSFKGSLSSLEAAQAIRSGFARVFPEADYRLIPLADGGEGTTEAVLAAVAGNRRTLTVTGPLFDPTESFYGLVGRRVVLEMATSAGLALVPLSKRNPLQTTTFGVGEMIKAAASEDIDEIIVGIGGSATNDGGCGLAEALGVVFSGDRGRLSGMTGEKLELVRSIDVSGIDTAVSGLRVRVACDVTNPLTGPEGAAAIYGPQKGATPEMVKRLDAGLANLAQVIRKDLGIDVSEQPGAGAAGGLGYGLMVFAGAELESGIDLVMESVGLAEKVKEADLVISGEGHLDSQTMSGKVLEGVGRICREAKIPCAALVGGVSPGLELRSLTGIQSVEAAVASPSSVEAAMENASDWLTDAAERAARWLKLGMGLA